MSLSWTHAHVRQAKGYASKVLKMVSGEPTWNSANTNPRRTEKLERESFPSAPMSFLQKRICECNGGLDAGSHAPVEALGLLVKFEWNRELVVQTFGERVPETFGFDPYTGNNAVTLGLHKFHDFSMSLNRFACCVLVLRHPACASIHPVQVSCRVRCRKRCGQKLRNERRTHL